MSFSEAWYDAEEDLQLPGPAVDTADSRSLATATQTSSVFHPFELCLCVLTGDRSVSGESSSSVLYVSNLPGHVTQVSLVTRATYCSKFIKCGNVDDFG